MPRGRRAVSYAGKRHRCTSSSPHVIFLFVGIIRSTYCVDHCGCAGSESFCRMACYYYGAVRELKEQGVRTMKSTAI